MRSAVEIEDRIRKLLSEELDRRVSEATRRTPTLCLHNHRQALDTRKRVEDAPNEGYNRTTDKRGLPVLQTIGLCMLGAEEPDDWNGTICEDEIDARRCPYFDPNAKKDDLLRDFLVQLADLEWLQANMPEVAALYWVIGSTRASVRLPWWKRIWYRFRRIQVEPQLPPFDPEKLLPPPL